MPTSRRTTAFLGKMSPKTKKYLTWGGAAVAGVLVFMRLKHDDKMATMSSTSKDSTPKPRQLSPAEIAAQMPSTSGQYPPVYPQGYSYMNPPPAVGYPSFQYPQTYQPSGYSPVGNIFAPIGYPGVGYGPGIGVSYPNPNNQAACQSVVGMNAVSARQRLLGLGIYAQVVNINGRPIAVTALQTGGPTAKLWVRNGIVQAAQCSATTGPLNPIPNAYPAAAY